MLNLKISVIIPVYNVEKFLRKCLNSVRFQTYSNLEIICIDDGSTDSSFEILQEFASQDNRFVVIKQKNRGVGASRNRGIKLATGDYIAFVDSDDWILLDLYETFVKKLKKSEADIYMFNVESYVKGRNDIARPMVFFREEDWNIPSGGVCDIYNCKRPLSSNFSHSNKICKSELIKKNKIKFPENIKYEDQVFSVKLFLYAKSIILDETVFYRYRNFASASLSQECSLRVLEIFKIVDMVEKLFFETKTYDHFKYALFQYKYMTYNSHYSMCPADLRPKYFKEMKKRLIKAEKMNIDPSIYTRLRNYNLFELIKNSDYETFENSRKVKKP